jgi:hypothetical protein
MMAKVKIQMYLDVSRCILMYMNGTHQDTCEIHARYMRDTWDTYPDNKPPPNSITNPTSPRVQDPELGSTGLDQAPRTRLNPLPSLFVPGRRLLDYCEAEPLGGFHYGVP